MSGIETEPEGGLLIDDAEVRRRAEATGLSARLEVADATRSLLSRLARTQADDERLGHVGRALRLAEDALNGQPERQGHVRSIEGALTGLGSLSELGPFTGRLHAIAPLGRLILGDSWAEANVTYDSAHQGAPGFVHGGFIAAFFDEMLGAVQRDTARMTVSLELKYRSPAPLHRELRYTTQLLRIEGRKAFVGGALHDGERLCAEASALFVAPRREDLIEGGAERDRADGCARP